MSANVEFNASIQVTELLMKTLENAAKDLAARCIAECASRHGFNADTEIQALGLNNLSVIRKQMAKKSVSKERVPKERAEKVKKSRVPMPFESEQVDMSGCHGLAFNRGLFTQCTKKPMENGKYCTGCQSEADKNASGCPDCGTVESRQNSGLYEFVDPKGRKPTHYLKVLEKLKITPEEARSEAEGLQIWIDEAHTRALEKSQKKPKGRPKKSQTKVEAENVSDLFARLVIEDKEDNAILEVVEDAAVEDAVVESKSPKTAKLGEAEKAAKKAALEAEKAAKKAALEAEKAAKKAALEAERVAKKAALEAERKAEADQKKAEREAKREAEKAEREAKREAEKAEREAEKAAKKATKKSTAASTAASASKAEADTNKVTVSKITINGKIYLKSSVNILYDEKTKEEVGIWDPESKTIKPLPDGDEEEEEEEEEEEGYETE